MRHYMITLTAAALAVAGGASACGSSSADQVSASAPKCPASAPARRVSAPQPAPNGALVRTGPLVVSVCQYAPGTPSFKLKSSLIPRIVIRGAAAAGLADVVNGAGPVTAFARHCDRPAGQLPFSQVFVFGYRSRPSRAVLVSHTGCMLAILTVGRRSAVLTGQLVDDLFAMTLLNPHSTGPRTPNLAGLAAAAASDAVRSHRFSIILDGAVIDQAARFGTVIFQVPPSGLRVDGIDSPIAVLLAVRPEPACTSRQLALSYFGAEPGAGNISAEIVVRDTSRSPCWLAGAVRVTGLNAQGHAVTGTVTGPITAPGVLSPQVTGKVNDVPPLGTLTEGIALAAEYRDDPASPNGLCAPHWIIPARWSVKLPGGIALSVPNADPGSQAKLEPSGAFVTCRGRFGLTSPVHYLGS